MTSHLGMSSRKASHWVSGPHGPTWSFRSRFWCLECTECARKCSLDTTLLLKLISLQAERIPWSLLLTLILMELWLGNKLCIMTWRSPILKSKELILTISTSAVFILESPVATGISGSTNRWGIWALFDSCIQVGFRTIPEALGGGWGCWFTATVAPESGTSWLRAWASPGGMTQWN